MNNNSFLDRDESRVVIEKNTKQRYYVGCDHVMKSGADKYTYLKDG